MKKRILLFLLVGILMATSLVGCGKKDTGRKSEGDTDVVDGEIVDDYEIDLGYYNCDHMVAASVGEAAGIYKDFGLNVKLTGNANVAQAMAAGQMDAGYMRSMTIVGANGQGSPVVIGANNHTGGSHYLVVANDIENPQDILGKPVSISQPDSDPSWLAGYSKSLNLPTDASQYELINMGSDKDKYVALSTGQISAYTACDPWGSMAEYEGVGKIMGMSMELDGQIGLCCAFTLNKNFIKDHSDLAVKLVEAHAKSLEYVYKHPYKAAEIFAEYYDVPLEVSLLTIYRKTVEEGRTLTWHMDDKQTRHAYDIYEKYDSIEVLPEFEDLLAMDIYEKAEIRDFNEFIEEEVDPVFPIGMGYEEFKQKAMEIDGIDE